MKKVAAITEARKEIQLPLSQALQKYPKLGEQNITNNPLKLRYFPTSVRPSIKNWMTDFHDNMGAGKHGAVDRGNYLFHSENGKKLTPMERQKLSVILKSLDEQMPLNIDPDAQAVVFTEQRLNMESNTLIGGLAAEGRNNNENLKSNIAIEDNYFQIPKSQPNVVQPIGNKNYSPNFKNNSDTAGQDNFKDFSDAGGKISFSSSQKFPNEIEKQSIQPKTNKNIVDLRS